MRVSNLYNNPASNNSYAGIINALRQVGAAQGVVLPKEYPPNYRGIIEAILDLGTLGDASNGEVPPGWKPIYDEDGNIIGGDWIEYPRDGQLWFDTRQGRLFIWQDGAFYQCNGADGLTVVGEEAPEREVIGGQWYNTTNNNLYIYDGTTWSIIGGQAAISTSTLPLATTTTDGFTDGKPILPDASAVITQAGYNSWIYTALEALETEVVSIDPEVPLYRGAEAPTETRDFWYDTQNSRLMVSNDGSYAPVSQPLTANVDFVSLSNTLSAATADLNNKITNVETDVETLQSLPSYTYTVTTDKNDNIHHGADVGVYVLNNNNQYTGVTITGTDGVNVSSDATGIRLNALELSTQVSEILNDYLQASDKLALQETDQDLQDQITAIDYVTPDDLAQLQQQVNQLPTTAEVSSRLSTAGGHLYGDLSMNGNLITGLPNPSTNSGAATKLYVDTLRTEVEQTYFKIADGKLRNVVIQNVNANKPAFDFSTSSADGNSAFKFKSNVGQSYATFGTNDKFWELAWDFDGKQDFAWKHNGTKVVSIASDGLVASTLKIGGFQENTVDGRIVTNPVDVGQTLNTHQSDIAALQNQVTSLLAAPSEIYYSDNAPTEGLENGNLWFDSANLRLNVRHGGAWVFPDRVEDTALKTSLLNAVNTSTDYASLKANLISALS